VRRGDAQWGSVFAYSQRLRQLSGDLVLAQRFNQSGDHLLAVLPFDVGDLTQSPCRRITADLPIVWMMAPRSVALSSAETFVSGAGRGPPQRSVRRLSIL